MTCVRDDFSGQLDARWQRYVVGKGALEQRNSRLYFVNRDTSARQYTNAQIGDYQSLPRRRFRWHPPLRLTVRARFSHPSGEIQGTAGFGFWNDPFLMTEARLPTLPRALWFFYASPPSDMKLDMRTLGRGWKAATLDALRPVALPLALIAPLAVLLMNLRPLYRPLWRPIQRALNVREALIDAPMADWHTYAIDWGTDHVSFRVDGEALLPDAPAPRGPLGFVMWLDNQYLIATPWGRFGWGKLEQPGQQWMAVERLAIVKLET
jgi:hypothetical protein